MFTGIITDIGTIQKTEQRGDLRLVIGCGYDMSGVAIGASIACSGVCLTVVDKADDCRQHCSRNADRLELRSVLDTVSTTSWRTSIMSMPKAEKVEGTIGMIAEGMPNSSIRYAPNIAPPPPKHNMPKSRGSSPVSEVIPLTASAMLLAWGVLCVAPRLGLATADGRLGRAAVVATSISGALLYGSFVSFTPSYNLLGASAACFAMGLGFDVDRRRQERRACQRTGRTGGPDTGYHGAVQVFDRLVHCRPAACFARRHDLETPRRAS